MSERGISYRESEAGFITGFGPSVKHEIESRKKWMISWKCFWKIVSEVDAFENWESESIIVGGEKSHGGVVERTGLMEWNLELTQEVGTEVVIR